ncbi:TPA: hypothetical protein ACX6QL_000052 [Photobacterium damselae]
MLTTRSCIKTVSLLLTLLLSACSSKPYVGEIETMEGVYTWGHEVHSFQPCNTDKYYWVEGQESVLKPLIEEASKLQAEQEEPYQPIYVKIKVKVEPQVTTGFAADYDGAIKILAVQETHASVPKQCKAPL